MSRKEVSVLLNVLAVSWNLFRYRNDKYLLLGSIWIRCSRRVPQRATMQQCIICSTFVTGLFHLALKTAAHTLIQTVVKYNRLLTILTLASK